MNQTIDKTMKPINQRKKTSATPIPVPTSEAFLQRLSVGAQLVFDARSLMPTMIQIRKMTFQMFRTQVIFRHRSGFMGACLLACSRSLYLLGPHGRGAQNRPVVGL
jgi:hypothetical protein